MKKSEMQEDIEKLLSKVSTSMHDGEEKKESDEIETLHIFPVEGGILILRDEEVNKPPIVESDPVQKKSSRFFYLCWIMAFLLMAYIVLGTLFPSLLLPSATIIITPAEQSLSAQQNIMVVANHPGIGEISGKLFSQTLTQSETVLASGRGHQSAAFANGSITLYNGLLSPQGVPQGTILTGVDGRQVQTSEAVLIPAANPPVEGEISVTARSMQIGASGNIGARDINEGCCGTGILAVNLTAFSGGTDARDFHFVTANDIAIASANLNRGFTASFTAALTANSVSGETAIPPVCTFKTRSNHRAFDQVNSAIVTVNASCKSVIYSPYTLQNAADTLLSLKAKGIDSHYTSLDGKQMKVTAQALTGDGNSIAVLGIEITGVWGYQFSYSQEESMKKLVAGKRRDEAVKVLLAIVGVKGVTITGIGQSDSLPENLAHIKVVFLYFVH